MTEYSFTSTTVLPDGRAVYVSIDIPADHPSVQDLGEVADHTEYAQMAAAHALRGLTSGDRHRQRREAERLEDARAQLAAKCAKKSGF